MKFFALILVIFVSQSILAAESNCGDKSWNDLSQDQRANVLSLDSDEYPAYYYDENGHHELCGTKIMDYVKYIDPDYGSQNNLNQSFVDYAEKVLKIFDDEVSREEIEQSPYIVEKDPELVELFMLIDKDGNILGSKVYYYQEGLEEDGTESDVNWQAYVRFDKNGDVLRNAKGVEYDELYFSWSGY